MGQLKDNSETRNELEEEIKRLETVTNGVSKPSLPTVKLDEMSYIAPSDDELRHTAETSLAEYRDGQIKAIHADSESTAKTLADKRAAYAESRDGDIAALNDSYGSAVRAVDSDAIKRGLARSSVAAVNRSALESEYLKRNADIVQSYGKKLSELDAEIAAVDGKLRAALDDFNLTYATKLNEKLSALKAERDKKTEDVIKYNNEIRAKQAALDAERAKTESALYDDAIDREDKATDLDRLSPDRRDAIYKSVYDKMDEYLGAMSEQQAKLEIRNHTLYRKHLSSYYYYKLFDKYGR